MRGKRKVVLRVNNKNKNETYGLVLTLILFACSLCINSNLLKFFICSMTLLFVIIIAKFSYFSFFSFVLWFSFLQEYFASINRMMSTGRLKWDKNIPIYYKELYICTMLFFIIELAVFTITNVLENEKKLYNVKLGISVNVSLLYALISLMLVIFSYPTLPTINANLSRNDGFISSALFVPIALLILASTYENVKRSNLLRVLWIANIIWILFHGERVIVFGLIVYVFLKYMNDINTDKGKFKEYFGNRKIWVAIIATIIVLLLGIRIQVTRMGGTFALSTVVELLVKQGTAADVVHVFNCATHMWKSGGGLGGYTYLQYLTCWIPFLEDNYSPAVFMMKKYNTLGGGLFFAEPMMNNGLLGSFVYSLIFILLLVWVFNKQSRYKAYVTIPFVILLFRFTWYASLAGWVSLTVYVVPVLYFVASKFK